MAEECTLFISYAEADKAWVKGDLLVALEEQAEVSCTDESDFTLGVPSILEFERAIRQSRYTLLVISEAYLADDPTRFTDILAQSYGEQEGTWPVIALTRQEGLQLPPRLKMLKPLKAHSSEQWEAAIERICEQLKRPLGDPSPKPACPYPGMIPFKENDQGRFFGRDEEIEDLLGRLCLHPFITVIGPSGSGKSSLVFAGLILKLKQSGLFGTGKWCIRSLRPGTTPLANLEAILGGDITVLEVRIEQLLSTQPDARRLLLVVDQFEELFTQESAEATEFQQALLRLMKIPNVYLILTVRADFYPDLMGSLLWEKIGSHRFEVLPLDEQGLKQAIVRPAEKLEVYIDSALVERLLVDAKREPGVLPLIQQTLVFLWEKLERRFLPLSAYELLVLPRPAYGGIPTQPRTGLQVAIAHCADAALADLETEEKKAIARRIFLRLIQFGEGRPDTRRQQLEKDLRSFEDDFHLFDETLENLASPTRRLLTFSGEEGEQRRKVDIAHEALIFGWPTLQQWISELREAEKTRRRLEGKAQEWTRLKKQGGLLDEAELPEAETWLSSNEAKILGYDKSLQDLITTSREAIKEVERQKKEQEEREFQLLKERLDEEIKRREAEEKAKKNAQIITAGSLIFSVVVMILGVFAFIQYRTATIKTLETFIATSKTLLATDNQLEALSETVKARSVLNQIFIPQDVKAKFRDNFWQQLTNIRGFNQIQDSDGWITSLSYSPDGKLIAYASVDSIKLLDFQNRQTKQTLQHPQVVTLSFSPDGKLLASGGMDNKLRIWKKQPNNDWILFKEIPEKNWISLVNFSPQGDKIATAGADKRVKIYSREGQLEKTCEGHKDQVMAVSFSQNSQYLASASKDKTVKIWNLNCRNLATIQNYDDVLSVIFLDDNTVIFGGDKLNENDTTNNITIWNWQNKQELYQLKNDNSRILYLALDQEKNLLASAHDDGTIKIWTIQGKLLETLKRHQGGVSEVSFSPDGQSLISGGLDKTVKFWRLNGMISQTIIGSSFSFSPDYNHQMLASGTSIDGTLYLWLWDNQKKLWQLQWQKKAHEGGIAQIRFSPDSQTIATLGMEDGLYGFVKVWDINGNLLNSSEKETDVGIVSAMAFNKDSQTIFVGYENGEIKSWQLDNTLRNTLSVKKFLNKHNQVVNNIKVTSHGFIASTSYKDNTIKIRQADGSLIQDLPTDNEQGLKDIEFSLDGKLLIASHSKNKIYRWQLVGKTFKPVNSTLELPTDNESSIHDINFYPDHQSFIVALKNKIQLLDKDNNVFVTLAEAKQNNFFVEAKFNDNGQFIGYSATDGSEESLQLINLESVINLKSQQLNNYDQLVDVGMQLSCNWLQDYYALLTDDSLERQICKSLTNIKEEQ